MQSFRRSSKVNAEVNRRTCVVDTLPEGAIGHLVEALILKRADGGAIAPSLTVA